MRQFQAFCFRIQSLAAILRDVARLLQKKGKCMLEFQFVGFTPRAVFKEAANKKIAELSQHMPQGSNFSARVIMIDSKFFFQVMCVNKTECFIAKEVLDPKKEKTLLLYTIRASAWCPELWEAQVDFFIGAKL